MNNNAYWQGYAEAALQRGVDPQMLAKSAQLGHMQGSGAAQMGMMGLEGRDMLASQGALGSADIPGIGRVPYEVLAALLGGGVGAGVGYGLDGGSGALYGGLGGAALGYGGAAGARGLGAFEPSLGEAVAERAAWPLNRQAGPTPEELKRKTVSRKEDRPGYYSAAKSSPTFEDFYAAEQRRMGG